MIKLVFNRSVTARSFQDARNAKQMKTCRSDKPNSEQVEFVLLF